MQEKDKREIQEILESLEYFLKLFCDNYRDSESGKNSKIRKEASRQVDVSMDFIRDLLKRNAIIYKLASGGEREESFIRLEYFNDIFRKYSFEKEVKEIIEKIRKLLSE